MTPKQEIAQWLSQIPDHLTTTETLNQLQSINKAQQEKTAKAHNPAPAGKPTEPLPPPLDSQAIKNEILATIARLPDNLTLAEAVCESAEKLRLFYCIEKDFQDVREGRALPYDQRDNTPQYRDEVPEVGRISVAELERMTAKEKLTHTIKLMPGDLTLGQSIVETLERMLFIYGLCKSPDSVRQGKTYTMEQVRQMMAKWRE